MSDRPVLYSFRRCPFAMRARWAVLQAGLLVDWREIELKDKPAPMLELSPKATVPVLALADGTVIDESLDIMLWALDRSDPENWLKPEKGDLDAMLELIGVCDGPFKSHLDRYKSDPRYPDTDRETEQAGAAEFLWHLDSRLAATPWLFGGKASLADFAILPFVRQFANSDRSWFDNRLVRCHRWLDHPIEF